MPSFIWEGDRGRAHIHLFVLPFLTIGRRGISATSGTLLSVQSRFFIKTAKIEKAFSTAPPGGQQSALTYFTCCIMGLCNPQTKPVLTTRFFSFWLAISCIWFAVVATSPGEALLPRLSSAHARCFPAVSTMRLCHFCSVGFRIVNSVVAPPLGGEGRATPMSVLDVVIDNLDKRLGICLGGKGEVEIFKQFMF